MMTRGSGGGSGGGSSGRFRPPKADEGGACGGDTCSVGDMRATWDALAGDPDAYVGDPRRGEEELRSLFGRLGADPRGGTCVEVGCGPGRMTSALAQRFDRVVAVDVSPEMLARARANVPDEHVEFRAVPGDRLTSLEDAVADVLVCYLVLQHLPARRVVLSYLEEFARVLKPPGEAFVQLPVLENGVRPRVWRGLRSAIVPLTSFRGPTNAAAFRGVRLTQAELDRGLERARLRVIATDTGPDAPYRYAHDLFLRLVRA
jgi:SAM-dependent methyltransferase